MRVGGGDDGEGEREREREEEERRWIVESREEIAISFARFRQKRREKKRKEKKNIGKRDIFGRTNRFLNFSKRASFWERNRSET